MFPGKAHAVGKKDTVIEHGKCRHEQTPDAEPYIVTVNLGAGGKSAAEMRGEPDKGNTKDDGIGAGAGRRFFMHLSVCLPPVLSADSLQGPAFLLLLYMGNV